MHYFSANTTFQQNEHLTLGVVEGKKLSRRDVTGLERKAVKSGSEPLGARPSPPRELIKHIIHSLQLLAAICVASPTYVLLRGPCSARSATTAMPTANSPTATAAVRCSQHSECCWYCRPATDCRQRDDGQMLRSRAPIVLLLQI